MLFKRLFMFVLLGFIAVNFCGCIFFVASLAESYKAKQDFNISYSEGIDVVKETLISQGLKFEEAIIKPNIAVVKGKYSDERTMYIEIIKISDDECSIKIRVGTTEAGKKDAQELLEAIAQRTTKVSKKFF